MLRRLRAGVHGRVTELARVAQRRYNLAMAVVMGRDLDAVICDTRATAQARARTYSGALASPAFVRCRGLAEELVLRGSVLVCSA